jgi:ferredoxin
VKGAQTMKISIDPERCQGHTVCALTAPELFTIRGDDVVASVDSEDVPPTLESRARLGANSCPERAIIISE